MLMRYSKFFTSLLGVEEITTQTSASVGSALYRWDLSSVPLDQAWTLSDAVLI